MDRSSASLGYANEGSSHIQGDHHTICKFSTRDDPGYQTIKNLLIQLVAATSPEHVLQPAPAVHDSKTEKKAYSLKDAGNVLGQDNASANELLDLRDIRVSEAACHWICQKETYQWWRSVTNQPATRYLWLKASPGAGKSVLMGYVIDQLRAEGVDCAFYFLRIEDAIKRTTRAFLLSMVGLANCEAQSLPVREDHGA